jgi:hypothetical protein
MGRSSVYNRLKLSGIMYFKSIGYTGGWGHFHIPDSPIFFWRKRVPAGRLNRRTTTLKPAA